MKRLIAVIVFAVCLSASPAARSEVIFDWAYVGNAGNGADTPEVFDIGGGVTFPRRDPHGAVAYDYRISKHEVTNAQYTEFLNAVDPEGVNTRDLFSSEMTSHANGGITLDSGASDGSKYQVKSGRGDNPVVFVSFFDAMRFTNWLHNGQGSGGTEAGVYTIGTGLDEVRSVDAKYFLPTIDEWFKAAYHKNDGVTDNYWEYATGTDTDPYSDQPPGANASNSANFRFDDVDDLNGFNDGYAATGSSVLFSDVNHLTDVGAYASSVSPYGTFDQSGNVREWTEQVWLGSFSSGRFTRGGDWSSGLEVISTLDDYISGVNTSDSETGFRVASVVPEPGSLVLTGLTGIALAASRRKR